MPPGSKLDFEVELLSWPQTRNPRVFKQFILGSRWIGNPATHLISGNIEIKKY
jgi:hypothetical protein